MDVPPLVALRDADFRKLWTGQLFAIAGTPMRVVAVTVQLYPLTHSVLSLGFIGLTWLIPMLRFSMKSGVTADACDRRKLMLAAQTPTRSATSVAACRAASTRALPIRPACASFGTARRAIRIVGTGYQGRSTAGTWVGVRKLGTPTHSRASGSWDL